MKKHVLLVSAILAALIAHACIMPPSIEIKTDNYKVSVPVRNTSFTISNVFAEVVKDAFSDFEVYDVINYGNTQAFLIGYEMDLYTFSAESDPSQYLNGIKDQMDSVNSLIGDIDPIYPEPIKIPKMTTGRTDNKWSSFDMKDFFKSIEDTINTNNRSTPVTTVPFLYSQIQTEMAINLPPALQKLPNFMVFRDEDGDTRNNFESAFVHTGSVKLTIRLSPPPPAGVELKVTDIELKGESSGRPIGDPVKYEIVPLNSGNNYTEEIVISLDDEEIFLDDPPQFSIGGIVSQYGNFSGVPIPVNFTLYMRPQVDDIVLRGAKGLKIGTMEQDLSAEMVEEIKMDRVDDLLNAKIEDGYFRITYRYPEYVENSGKTGCEGVNVGYRLYIEQKPSTLDGRDFPGLFTDPSNPFTPDNTSLNGKQISGEELTVNKTSRLIISTEEPNGATFELFDDKAQNGYENEPLSSRSLPVMLDLGMNINKLEVVRWRKENAKGESIIPVINVPSIDFSQSTNNQNTQFVKSISFEKFVLDLDFTVPTPAPDPPGNRNKLKPGPGLPPALEGRLAMIVNSPKLGFINTTEILNNGPDNIFESEEVKNLEVNSDTSSSTLDFDVLLVPVINGQPKEDAKYMEFGPIGEAGVPLEDVELNIYATAKINYEWTEAEIDIEAVLAESSIGLEKVKGTYPQTLENEEYPKETIDISDFGELIHGLNFSNRLTAKIFLTGPYDFLDIIDKEDQPTLTVGAVYGYGDEDPSTKEPLLLIGKGDEPIKIHSDSAMIPSLPGENAKGEYKFDYAKLWKEIENFEGGYTVTEDFNRILTAFPNDMFFTYGINMKDQVTVRRQALDDYFGLDKNGRMVVTPAMLEALDEDDDGNDDEDGTSIKATIILLLPLEFVAEPGAYIALPPDIFGDDSKDLFGRKSKDAEGIYSGRASIFPDITIKSLGVKIEMDHLFFNNTRLHMDENPEGKRVIFGDKGLAIDNDQISIIFTGEERKNIETYLVYPKIRIEFPTERTVRIHRNFKPSRITFAASGSYTLNLDDLLQGN